MLRDYNIYLKGMEKANDEKLFFLDQLDLNQFDRLIDFGCGQGNILKACRSRYPHLTLVGVDWDAQMLKYTKANIGGDGHNIILCKEMSRDMINDKTVIVFSSVLHEVKEYWAVIKDMISGTGATVVVRDMRFSAKEEPICDDYLADVIRHSQPRLLADFIDEYGFKTDRDLYHYLLKYSYVDNWELELKENYFGFNYDELFELGEIVYERNYLLKYKESRVIEDFGIWLSKPTHTQLIIKLRKE